MRNSFKKQPFNLWWISNKTIMEIENVSKAVTFKSFAHQIIKTHNYFFLRQYFSIIFMRQTLTDYFWGLHKNKNSVFPLKSTLKTPEQ